MGGHRRVKGPLALLAAVAMTTGCGSDDEQACSGEDACSAIRGVAFVSVEELSCGPHNPCHWEVSFFANGEYRWDHTDLSEHGTYTCECGLVHGQGTFGDREGEYDGQTGLLTWEGRAYEAQ